MIKIWKEKIVATDAIDSGHLFRSVMGVHVGMDQKVSCVTLKQEFSEYGHYVARGTGRNTPRGNPGDIGKPNPRKKKKWFLRKYLASMYNIREFMADSLGMQACSSITNALEKIPDTTKSV